MSASKQKKVRQEKKMIYMTERQIAEAKEAKKLKTYTLTFWIVLAVCVSIVLGTFAVNPVRNVLYKNTVAVTVGDHELNAVEFNYFYIDAINAYCNRYSSYISYILSLTTPLSSQMYDKSNNITWADAFVNMAISNVKSTYALYDEAIQKGHTLSEDEQKEIDEMFDNLDANAKKNGYNSAKSYLRDAYGNGADVESYRAYYEINALADSYYTAYSDSLEYSADDLRAYEKGSEYEYNSYTYSSYYIKYENYLETKKDEDGKEIAATDDEIAAAVAAAKQAADELAAGKYESIDDFEKAVQALPFNKDVKDVTVTRSEDVLYSSVNSLFQDWIIGKVESNEDDAEKQTEDTEDSDDEDEKVEYVTRVEGDMTVIEYSTTSNDVKTIKGYYVIRYGSVNDNTFLLKNVRHILFLWEGGTYNSSTYSYTYTDAEKKATKEKAEEIFAQWEASDKTEDFFAELANKNSDDGDGTTGGLYENIYPGQMVEEFEDWCYDEKRQPGDCEMVMTEDYGWHIMYFVGNSDTNYRDYMITNVMRNEDVSEWHEELTKDISFEELNTKYVNRDLILSAS